MDAAVEPGPHLSPTLRLGPVHLTVSHLGCLLVRDPWHTALAVTTG